MKTNNQKSSHSGDQNFNDPGSAKNSKRSGNRTGTSSSEADTDSGKTSEDASGRKISYEKQNIPKRIKPY